MGKRVISLEHKQRLAEGRKENAASRISFVLDSHTRLSSDRHCFILDIRRNKESDWKGTYFYSTIADAIRGYIKYKSKKKLSRKATDDFSGLLEHLAAIEKLLEETANAVQTQILDTVNDPILASFCGEQQ